MAWESKIPSNLAEKITNCRRYGIPWDIYDRLSRKELEDIHKAWIEDQKIWDGRFAHLMAVVAQPHSKKRLKAEDFMPKYKSDDESEPNWEESHKKFHAHFAPHINKNG